MRPLARLVAALTAGVVLAGAGCSARSDPSTGPSAADSPSSAAANADAATPDPTTATTPDPTSPATPSPSETPSPSSPGAALPQFSAQVQPMGPELRELVTFSHRRGCPVELRDLRHLRMSFVRFDGSPAVGKMIVHRDSAEAVVRVFRRLYLERWPIARMRLVDDYRGDDELSMAANNTSGYNCRRVVGTDRWSDHAYGRAIDINPVQNPYVVGSSVQPLNGRRFSSIDRTADADVPRGAMRSDDVVVSAFEDIGWEWGGYWVNSKDYQHFSSPGG